MADDPGDVDTRARAPVPLAAADAKLEATVAGITATLPVIIEPGLVSVSVPATVTGGYSSEITSNTVTLTPP